MASSSSSFHSVPASISWNYDMFLSFRGEDTRKSFVDHLYMALEQQGIHTYKDDETLSRGESIGPALMKAIQESRLHILWSVWTRDGKS
ncbi:putative TIR domain-containing protein [Helianthus anomalus]